MRKSLAWFFAVAILTTGLVLALGGSALGRTAPDTALPWSVSGAGGGSSASTNYALGSTIGQSSPAGQSESTNYELGAGYWYGAIDPHNDHDGDGYIDLNEIALPENAYLYCATMRADVNHDATVTIVDLAAVAAQFLQSVPPALARYDQGIPASRDGVITIGDLAVMAANFLQPVSACPNS